MMFYVEAEYINAILTGILIVYMFVSMMGATSLFPRPLNWPFNFNLIT